MKTHRIRFGKRRNSSSSRRGGTVLFKRFAHATFEFLELRSMLSGDSLLADSQLAAGGWDEDLHASPVETISLASLLSSNLNGGSATPLAATDGGANAEQGAPIVDPLVDSPLVQVKIKLQDLNGNAITSISVGQDFKVLVTAQDVRAVSEIGNNFGVFGAVVASSFNSSLVSLNNAASLTVDSQFNLAPVKDTSTAGTIIAGGSRQSLEAPGKVEQLLWSVTLHANSAGVVNFATAYSSLSDWGLYGKNSDNGNVTADQVDFGTAQLTVQDNVTVSIGNVTQVEGNAGSTNFLFTATLSSTSTQQVTVAYTTQNGTATAGSDYTATNGILTFAPGQLTQVVTIAVTGDLLNEADEVFNVLLSNPTNATVAQGTGIGTITNEDAVPTLSFSAGTVASAEGNSGTTAIVYTVNLSAASGQPVTVQYATSDGTATSGSDYTATSGTLTFTAGQTQKLVTVLVNGDLANELDETYTLTLSAPTNATLGATASSIATITNDDAVPSLTLGNVSQNEGNVGTTPFVFTATLSAASGQQVLVTYSTTNGTATAGSDYTATSGTLTFAPGQTSQVFTVNVTGDTASEVDENFTVNLSAPQNATLGNTSATGTIVSDDPPLLDVVGATQAEGNAANSLVFTVSLSRPSATDVLVPFTTQDGTATAGSDYVAKSGTLTFAAGTTSQLVTVVINGDTTKEANEDFKLVLTKPANADFAASNGQATASLTNDDGPAVSFVQDSVSHAEGNSGTTQYVFTVSLGQAGDQPVTVVYTTQNGTATAGSDYTAKSGTLTFAPGVLTQDVTVLVNGDLLNEPDEAFTLLLSDPTNATLAETTVTGTITNDDAIPTVSLQAGTVTTPEGNSGTTAIVYTISLSAASGQQVTVQYATANGSATAGSDYTANSGTLTFESGETQKLVTVLVNGDLLHETDETYTLALSAPTNATLGPTASSVATITNDDAIPTVSLSAGTISQAEGNSGTTAYVYTINLSAASGQQVTVQYATTNGSATAGSDYTAASGTLTFAPGDTQKVVTVLANGDLVNEADETFTLSLSAPTNATLGATASSLSTIANDDAIPTLTLLDVTKNEGNSGTTAYVFTATLSAASSQQVLVTYTTANGTATAGSDYTATSGTLTFTAGQTSQVFTVLVNGDTSSELDETFTVNLTAPQNVSLGTTSATGTIVNDDALPVASISNATTQNEGNTGTTPFLFTVSLSAASNQEVTVVYTTANAIATTADGDYVAQSGTLTFAAGETSKVITVLVNGDTRNEADETFRVNLTSAVHATVGTAVGNAIITNDDPLPTISITDMYAPEGDTGNKNFAFTVSLSAASSQSVTVKYATADGRALVAGSDYVATSGTLTFAPGQTSQTITVQVIGDKFTEVDEDFAVNLSGAGFATIADSLGIGVIQNESTDNITFTKSTLSGKVFVDSNGNGVQNGKEKSLGGLTVTLTGTPVSSAAVTRTTTTAADGSYVFADIDPGTYTVLYDLPVEYQDGTAQIGSQGGTALDGDPGFTTTIALPGGVTGTGNNFLTRGFRTEFLSQRLFMASTLGGDATPPPAVTVNVAVNSVTNPINTANSTTTTASGTGTVGATISVVARDAANHASNTVTTVVAANGTWTANGINVSSINDGTLTYTVTATLSGQTATKTITSSKDTLAPSVLITNVTNPINTTNVTTTSINGTGSVGATVSVTATDGTHTTAAQTATISALGAWTVSNINVSTLNNGTITYTVTASDSAGNTTTATITSTKDTEAPALTVGTAAVINAANAATITLSGTGTIGATITVVASDGTDSTAAFSGTVGQDGNWTINNINTSALDDGTITYTITATDGANNTTQLPKTTTKDTLAPALVITTATSPINHANEKNTAISGTGEANATFSIVASRGGNNLSPVTGTIAQDGTWSKTGIDVSELTDGTVTYTVTVTDAAGNTTVQTKTSVKDTVLPELTIADVTDPIGLANAASVELSGTGEAAATLSIVASDGTTSTPAKTGTIAGGGTWTVAGIDVSALNDGTITFTVNATDAAGNTTQKTITAVKTTLTATSLTTPVNIANAAHTTISGSGQIGATVSVVVSDGTDSTVAKTAIVGGSGFWTVDEIDVSALDDGTLTYTATATLNAHSVHVSRTTTKDTVAPALVASTATTPVNNTNKTAAAISGTGEAGATLSVVVSQGATNLPAVAGSVAQDGTWSITPIDLSTLADGAITYTVTATDAAGNTTTKTSSGVKDTVAPALALGSVTNPISMANDDNTTIDGTGEIGATISVTVTDGTATTAAKTATVAGDGTWSITGIDVTALADGTLTYHVTASDAAGNVTAPLSLTSTKATLTVSTISPINAASDQSVTVSGIGLAGATISIVPSSGATSLPASTATVAGDGTWTVSGIDVSTLADGTITFTVTATNGSDVLQRVVTANKDATPPAVAIDAAINGINSANVASVTVSGTGEVGATIKVEIKDGVTTVTTATVIVGAGGTWSVSGIDATTLADGLITYHVTATDGVGNSAEVDKDALKDTVAPALTVTPLAAQIAIANAANVTVSGTGEAGTTVSVVVTNGASTAPKTTIVLQDGTWTVTGINVTALADGTLTFNVTATDSAGNATTTSTTKSKDTVGPALALTQSPTTVNAAGASNTTLKGTADPGVQISITATDGVTTTIAYGGHSAVNGTWSRSGIDVSGLNDGTITYTITASEGNGNSTQITVNAEKDTAPPTVAITSVTDPIDAGNADTTSINGTGEAGATLSVVASDGVTATVPFTGTIAVNGSWVISGINVTTLANGPITYTVTATDAAGNTAQVNKVATKDTTSAGPLAVMLVNTDPGFDSLAQSVAGQGDGASALDEALASEDSWLPNLNV